MPNVSFKARLYTSEPLDNGKFPIVLQVSWRDTKPQIRRKRLGMSCRKEEWDRDNNLLNKEAWSSIKKNAKINEALDKASSTYFDLEVWDYKQWAKSFENGHQVLTFSAFVEKLIAKQMKLQKAGTGIYYRDVLHALQKFMDKDEIHFNEITKKLLKDFEEDILTRGFKGDRTMRGLKALYSKAVEDEVVPMKLMPFKTAYNPVGYRFSHLKKIKTKKKQRIDHLSDEEIDAIKNYEPKTQAYQKAKDIWLFSYYTMGVNLKDIALLQRSDIKNGVWYFDREKTSTGYESTPLRKECLEIIDRWYHPHEKYIFHDILRDKYDSSDEAIKKRTNNYLSNLRRRFIKMSKELEFDGHFVMYSARYSSGARALRMGVDIRALQGAYRHSSVTTTEGYVPRKVDPGVYEVL